MTLEKYLAVFFIKKMKKSRFLTWETAFLGFKIQKNILILKGQIEKGMWSPTKPTSRNTTSNLQSV